MVKPGDKHNAEWNVGAVHSLYSKSGSWYSNLTRFPGALFDPKGYILFRTKEEYYNCPHLQIGIELNVPDTISKIAGYVQVIGIKPATWIVQGNPTKYDIDTYLQKYEEIYWTVRTKNHREMMDIGDHVYIWRAAGNGKHVSGVIAAGQVIERCKPKPQVLNPNNMGDELWIGEIEDDQEVHVGIAIDDVRIKLQEGMLPKQLLETDDILKTFNIISAPRRTTYATTPIQARRLDTLWNQTARTITDESPYKAYKEGSVQEITLDRYVRNYHARQKCIEIHGYSCKVCGLNFEQTYGEIGRGYIQVHHISQISESTGIHEIDPERDLLPVCANCHAMLHRNKPPYTPEELKKKIRND